ncbi:unnamed protein product, partial [Iphiclides podalirius]
MGDYICSNALIGSDAMRPTWQPRTAQTTRRALSGAAALLNLATPRIHEVYLNGAPRFFLSAMLRFRRFFGDVMLSCGAEWRRLGVVCAPAATYIQLGGCDARLPPSTAPPPRPAYLIDSRAGLIRVLSVFQAAETVVCKPEPADSPPKKARAEEYAYALYLDPYAHLHCRPAFRPWGKSEPALQHPERVVRVADCGRFERDFQPNVALKPLTPPVDDVTSSTSPPPQSESEIAARLLDAEARLAERARRLEEREAELSRREARLEERERELERRQRNEEPEGPRGESPTRDADPPC